MAIATSDIGHSRSDHVRVVLRVANGYLAVSSRDCPAKCGAFFFRVDTPLCYSEHIDCPSFCRKERIRLARGVGELLCFA